MHGYVLSCYYYKLPWLIHPLFFKRQQVPDDLPSLHTAEDEEESVPQILNLTSKVKGVAKWVYSDKANIGEERVSTEVYQRIMKRVTKEDLLLLCTHLSADLLSPPQGQNAQCSIAWSMQYVPIVAWCTPLLILTG